MAEEYVDVRSTWMSVCVYMCTSIGVYDVYVCIHECIYVCVHVYVCEYVHIFICECIVSMHVYMNMYLGILHMYVYACVSVYMCVYT